MGSQLQILPNKRPNKAFVLTPGHLRHMEKKTDKLNL